jgi:hypothetical protein
MIPSTNNGNMAKGLFYTRHKRAVGKFDATDLIVPAIVIGAAYYLFTQVLGDSGTTANNSTVEANTTATVAADLAAAQAAGIKQTIPDSTLSSYADTLYQLMVADPIDQASIFGIMIQPSNQVDFSRLEQLFGTRKANTGPWYSACALTSFQCDSVNLGTFLAVALDASHRSEVNSYYSMQGINSRI